MNVQLPRDDLLERKLISAIFCYPDAADYIFSETSEDDYCHSGYALLFKILKNLHLQGRFFDIDFIYREIQFLEREGEFTLQDLKTLSFLSDYIAFEECCSDLKCLTSARRLLQSQIASIAAIAKNPQLIDDHIDAIQNDLMKVKETEKKGTQNLRDDVLKNFSNGMNFEEKTEWMVKRRALGLPTFDGISSGYPILDETLGYFQNSCIYYIGARTSMGKTTFILNLIQNMTKHKVGIFSLEMPSSTISAKLLCIAADVKFSHWNKGILYPEKKERLYEAMKMVNQNIFIEDPGSITIARLRARAKRMKQVYGIEILFVDYLTRIQSNSVKASNHLAIDEISKGLQSLAKELEIPIVCLAQLNRQSAKNSQDGEPPTLTDFRESGSIEEDADACILIHRRDYYNPIDKPGQIEVIVAKNRIQGDLKKIPFSCNFLQSDRYFEMIPIEEEMKAAKDQENLKKMESQIDGRWN